MQAMGIHRFVYESCRSASLLQAKMEASQCCFAKIKHTRWQKSGLYYITPAHYTG
jgi:hypothetical protein